MFKKVTVIKNEAKNDVLFWRSPIKTMDRKTQLLVRSTDIAIFEKGGVLLDILEAGQYDIFDKKSQFYNLFSNRKDTVEVDIIYMSKTVKNRILWGTPNHLIFKDPVHHVDVAIGASGEIEVQIKNPRKFYLELVGRNKHYTIYDLKQRLRTTIVSILEESIRNQAINEKFSLEELSVLTQNIQANVEETLKQKLEKEYGIQLSSFRLSRIFITPESKQKIQETKEKKVIVDRKENIDEKPINITNNNETNKDEETDSIIDTSKELEPSKENQSEDIKEAVKEGIKQEPKEPKEPTVKKDKLPTTRSNNSVDEAKKSLNKISKLFDEL